MTKGHDNDGRDLWPRTPGQKYARPRMSTTDHPYEPGAWDCCRRCGEEKADHAYFQPGRPRPPGTL